MTRRAAFLGIILLSEALYLWLLRFEPRTHITHLMLLVATLFALYAAAVALVRRIEDEARLIRIILAGAVLFRLTLVPLGLGTGSSVLTMMRDDLTGRDEHFRSNLLLDDDVWRYLWDGHVSAEGGSPYGAAPGDRSIRDGLWRDVQRNINHADLPTIYPPVAELVFFVAHSVAPGSIVALKLVLIACDLLGIIVLVGCLRRLRRPSHDVLLYAWNPLPILMFAGAAHVDVVMVTLLSLAAYFLLGESGRAAGVTLGMATLAKLSPVVLWPLFARRFGRSGVAALLATTALVAAPFLLVSAGGLQTFLVFAKTWDFNSATFAILRHAARPFSSNPDAVARIVSAIFLAAIVAWMARRGTSSLADASMNTLGALLLLSPTVMPWYATWPLGFAALARRSAVWLSFSALVCLSFPMTADWKTHPGWLTAEYGALAVVALVSALGTRQRASMCNHARKAE